MSEIQHLIAGVELGKSDIEKAVNSISSLVESGELNPLEAKLKLKMMEEAAKKAQDSIAQSVRDEAERYGSKSFDYMGAKFELAEVGTKYDYEACGDPEYERLKQKAEDAKRELDERCNFLKSLKKPTTVIIEETGEVCTVNPPVKSSTSSIKITLR